MTGFESNQSMMYCASASHAEASSFCANFASANFISRDSGRHFGVHYYLRPVGLSIRSGFGTFHAGTGTAESAGMQKNKNA